MTTHEITWTTAQSRTSLVAALLRCPRTFDERRTMRLAARALRHLDRLLAKRAVLAVLR